MEPLSRILPKTLHRLGLSEHATTSLTVHRAQIWITKQLPRFSECISVKRIDGEVILIACDHPVAAQELRQVTMELLAFLASHTDVPAPREARITRS